MRSHETVKTCQFCGKEIKGCGPHASHERKCQEEGNEGTTALYHIVLPAELHRDFQVLCKLKGETQKQAVIRLIQQEIACENHKQ